MDVDQHIDHFRKKVVETKTAGNWPAQILINLLVRVDRYREALDVSLEYLPGTNASEIACPLLSNVRSWPETSTAWPSLRASVATY